MGPARDSFLFEVVFCHLSKDPSCDPVRYINFSFIPVDLNWLSFTLTAFFWIFAFINAALISVLILIWGERRLIGKFQARLGPNRWGPLGLFTPIADAIKVMFKEDVEPTLSDKLIYVLAPILMVVPVFMIFPVIPYGAKSFLTDISVGVVFVLAITSINSLSVLMAGWASGNRFAIIGGIRAVAMLLSYEIPMGISAAGVVIIAGSLSLSEVVESQIIPNVIFQPLGFIVFLVASTAELNRSPFDITEAESELVAGYMTDYSSMKFGLFYLGEFMATIASSAIIVTFYLSGWRGPSFLPIPGEFWFFSKWIGVIAIFIWFRATFPRLRIDQIMSLAWKGLFELSLINILVIALTMAIWPDPTNSQLFLMTGINWVVFFASIYIFGKILSPDLTGNKIDKRKVVYGLD